MASLHRRSLIAAAPAILLASCEPRMPTTVSTTPRIDVEGFGRALDAIAARAAPGVLGVGLANLESGQAFLLNGERRFPMQSVFKLPLAAAVLAEVDAGRARMDERFELTEEQLSPQHSPISAAWPARRSFSLRDLLEATVVESDNTAADVLMKHIGGPGAVSAWLVGRRVPGVRVDRYERQLACDIAGMPSFRPQWRTAEAFAAARAATPPTTRQAAQRAYMADPRDTATPRGMIEFLQMLDKEELISRASTRGLLRMMSRTARGAARLKAGLPRGAFLAHRPGTAAADLGVSAAHNDVGIFTLADRRAYAIAVFLSGSTLDEAGRDAIIARIADAAVRAIG
ncbi:class A beta-lactamase [Phenylobacterium sp.]|uniref:class A beta-lactamase n=1 Tax=Phenylobacterium sp. TaxID=1871053 RepID=UPI0025DCA82C|nr:class A beta-lactamase [Phenylobacterium sp.]